LNYRVIGDPDDVLDMVANAAKKYAELPQKAESHREKKANEEVKSCHMDNDQPSDNSWNWLQRRYCALEAGAGVNPTSDHWDEILYRDELLAAFDEGKVLHGFREGKINFPPSYRRCVKNSWMDDTTSNKQTMILVPNNLHD